MERSFVIVGMAIGSVLLDSNQKTERTQGMWSTQAKRSVALAEIRRILFILSLLGQGLFARTVGQNWNGDKKWEPTTNDQTSFSRACVWMHVRRVGERVEQI